ncbi:MAG: SDR family NAD(P)-dependent oxidoreductase [Clostridia bacterium]|nr:SDR family NAD(P)-dependent oxidoreductase [Clostridia bacterium]
MSLSKRTLKYLKKHCRRLDGKTALITGGNAGIGFKTAETLVQLGAAVILACRNETRANAARETLLRDHPGADIRIMRLDVADFASIDAFAKELPDVDVFINNAGVFHRPGEKTADGLELVMGTNYVGTVRVGEKVLPELEKCGHDVVYINTISLIHKFARVDLQKFYDEKGSYARSKLCLARYTEHLAQKYRGTNIHVYMSHPGIAITGIASHLFGKLYILARIMPFNSVEKSSLAAAYILSGSVPEGSVVGPHILFCGWGYPKVNRKSKRALREIEPLVEFTAKETARTAEKTY